MDTRPICHRKLLRRAWRRRFRQTASRSLTSTFPVIIWEPIPGSRSRSHVRRDTDSQLSRTALQSEGQGRPFPIRGCPSRCGRESNASLPSSSVANLIRAYRSPALCLEIGYNRRSTLKTAGGTCLKGPQGPPAEGRRYPIFAGSPARGPTQTLDRAWVPFSFPG